MKQKKTKKGHLQFKILLPLLISLFAIQSVSAIISYYVFERDLISKRNEDLKPILFSFSESLGTDLFWGVTNVAKQSVDTVYPKYEAQKDQLIPGSALLDQYLKETQETYDEKTKMGMSLYGTALSMLTNSIIALGTPSASKFLSVVYLVEETQEAVVIAGDYDDVNYNRGDNKPQFDVMSMGYRYSYDFFAPYYDEGIFIGLEIKDDVHGHVYVSGARIPKVNTEDCWVITETDRSWFTKQMDRFLITFIQVSLTSVLTTFVILFLLIHFLFVRRLQRVSRQANDSTQRMLSGNYDNPFSLSSSRRKDELDALNDNLFYLQGGLAQYVENLRLAVSNEEKSKAELALSSQIQLSALPSKPIIDKSIFVYPLIKLAKQVGGDLYDYFYVDENRFVFLIGDVSGKGVPAALFMMKSNALIRSSLHERFEIDEEIVEINNILSKDNPIGLFITAFIGVVDIKAKKLTYVNCGHEEVFFRHDGVYHKLNEESNLPLGLMEDFAYQKGEISLVEGDALFLYTDGVSEAENIRGEFYGKQRIEEKLSIGRKLPLSCLLPFMLKDVDAFQEGKEQADDICMVGFGFGTGTMELMNTFEDLDRSSEYIDEALASIRDERMKSEFHIAMDELLSNVVRYAYEGKPGKYYFTLRVDKKQKKVHGSIVDKGIAFNPLREEETAFDENKEGGLGIIMAKSFLQEIDYERIDDYNVLTFSMNYQD